MHNPFSPYARIFTVPGSRSFSFAGWLARVPMSTVGLGSVLLVAGETGSYGLAGAVAGTLSLAFAVGSPQWARGMDRDRPGPGARLGRGVPTWCSAWRSPRRVVLDAPRWSWFVLAALTGACGANVGAAVRARWAHALPDADDRQTAFAFESVVDEVVFVVGPPSVTFLAALIAPPAGFLVGLVVGVAGSVWLARQEATQPPVHRRPTGGRVGRDLRAEPDTARGRDRLPRGRHRVRRDGRRRGRVRPAPRAPRVMAGVALAAYAGGSLVSGLSTASSGCRARSWRPFVGCAVFFGVVAQGLLLVGSLTWLVPAAFLAGLAIAPVLVSGMSLVESRVPRAALNEGLTWTTTGLTLGVTAGAAVAGAAVDTWGAQTAFVVPALGAAAAGVLALLGAMVLRRPAPAPVPASALR